MTRVEVKADGHARFTLTIGAEAVKFSTADLVGRRRRARAGPVYATTIYNAQDLTVDRAIVIGN